MQVVEAAEIEEKKLKTWRMMTQPYIAKMIEKSKISQIYLKLTSKINS